MLKNRPAKQTGFTLLELLIVSSIIAIVISLAAPSYLNWQKQASTRHTAKAIMLTLQRAQNAAISHGHQTQVKLHTGEPGCVAWVAQSVCFCHEPDCKPGTYASVNLRVPVNTLQLARPNRITFDAFSGLSQGAAGSVTVGRPPYLIRIVVNNLGRQRWCTAGAKMAGIIAC